MVGVVRTEAQRKPKLVEGQMGCAGRLPVFVHHSLLYAPIKLTRGSKLDTLICASKVLVIRRKLVDAHRCARAHNGVSPKGPPMTRAFVADVLQRSCDLSGV